MGVALRRADRQPCRRRDLLERHVERILQSDNLRLRRRQLGEAAAELEPRLRCRECALRVAVRGNALVFEERLGAPLPARLSDVLARVDDEPVQPGRKLRLALELADALHELHKRLLRGVAGILGVAQHVLGDAMDTLGMAFTQRGKRKLVSVFCTSHKDGVGKLLVDERRVRPQVTDDSTAAATGRLHAPTLVAMALTPDAVLPALRGAYGREYHYAVETATTQRMLPPDAVHGAVALAERQTAGRGRMGRTWVDSALMFSVVLRPAEPVARWPELTLVAAHAVADAIGAGATIKYPNDVLLDGKKVAGILAEASERVVLGVGINVGSTAWPGSGFVDRDRLDLLVDVLERLERGYGEWTG
jgi:Biotin/lipoate A/B protein ligase family